MRREPSTEVPLRLADGWLWASARPGPGITVHCDRGALWVTQAGNPADVCLAPGQSFTPAPDGKLVVQSLAPDSVLRLRRPRAVQPLLHDLTDDPFPRAQHRAQSPLRQP